MFLPDLASLDLQECCNLPPATLVGPLSLIREVRCALGSKSDLNLIVGDSEAVQVSSDLFAAFQAWENAQEAEDDDDTLPGSDQAWLN